MDFHDYFSNQEITDINDECPEDISTDPAKKGRKKVKYGGFLIVQEMKKVRMTLLHAIFVIQNFKEEFKKC